MSVKTCLIKEVVCYVGRFKEEAIVVKLDSSLSNDAGDLGLPDDIYTINKSGINIIVVCDADNINLEDWDKNTFFFCEPENFNSNEGFGDRIPVLVVPSLTDEFVVNFSVKLCVRKIIFVTNQKGVFDERGNLISLLNITKSQELIDKSVVKGRIKNLLLLMADACKRGIKRTHIISGREKGSLLLEIFSCDGVGTMVLDTIPYGVIRKIQFGDACLVRDIVAVNFPISLKAVRENLQSWYVFEIDGEVIACVQLSMSETNIDISFLSCDENYDEPSVLRKILTHLCETYKEYSLCLDFHNNSVIPLIYPWFKELGFRKNEKEGIYFRG